MPTLPCPQMPKMYGTPSWISVAAISSPPFILGMADLPGDVLPPRSSCQQRHHALLAHFPHSMVRPFAAEAARLAATVRHHVHARARCFVDVHAAHFQLACRTQRVREAVREEAGREPERRGVHTRDR